jgi:putative hydrolase of the HAD superfamily
MTTLFWDFDGTIGYREGMWTGTLISLLEKMEIRNIKKEDIRPFLNIGFTWHSPDTPHKDIFHGKTWWEYYEGYFQEIFEKVGVKKNLAQELSKRVKDEYLEKSMWFLFDDSIETLEIINKSKYQNVVLSNHVPELTTILENIGVLKYFKQVYSSGNLGFEKPNRKIFEYAINDLKIQNTECVMIGDSYEADIAGALRAGIKAILVRSENKKDYKWYSKNLNKVIQVIENMENESPSPSLARSII